MGKETKIGLAVIGVLMSAFGVLLLRHLHVAQSPGRWEGESSAAAQPLASASANDKRNVVLAQADAAAGDTGDALWNSTSQAPAELASDVPSASYMPAETEGDAAPDRYSIGRDIANDSPLAAHQPIGANPFGNRGLDDDTADGARSTANATLESPGEFPTNDSSRDSRPNPLRLLSAEVPLDSAEEPTRAEPNAEPTDPLDQHAIDTQPAMPDHALGAEPSASGAEPGPDDDPFGPDPFAEPRQDERHAPPADDPFGPPAGDLGQQPLEDDGRLQPAGDDVPREPVADDWQSGGASYEPRPVRDQPLPIENGIYTVQPNDTLWRISEKVYGTGGYFKALAAHNRANLPRSDRLAVGMRIAVPQVGELEQQYPSLCPKPRKSVLVKPRAVRATATVPTAGGDAYVVQEGDTLFDIARYELGKASRWAEIYELNRDQLGEDFDYLRPGAELRLPPKSRAAETISRGRDSRYLR